MPIVIATEAIYEEIQQVLKDLKTVDVADDLLSRADETWHQLFGFHRLVKHAASPISNRHVELEEIIETIEDALRAVEHQIDELVDKLSKINV